MAMHAHASTFDTWETGNGQYWITIHKHDTIDGYEYIVSVEDTDHLAEDEPIEEMIFDNSEDADKAAHELFCKYNEMEAIA